MAKADMRLKGVVEMQRKLAAFQQKFPKAVARALYFEAGVEMTESKRRCPVYSPDQDVIPTHIGGTLRASGHVLNPVIEASGKIYIDLVYGGKAQAYATVQHEGLSFHHNVGQARYLASVLEESEATMSGRVATRVQFNQEMIQ